MAVTVMGGDNGNIYLFEGADSKHVIKAHDGPVNCIAHLPGEDGIAGFSTGGSDGVVRFWDPWYRATETFDLRTVYEGRPCTVRSIDCSSSTILIGTKENEILEVDVASKKVKIITKGHAGDVNAVAAHPMRAACATGSDDGLLRIWDTRAHTLACSRPMPRSIRAVACHPSQNHVAVGLRESPLKVRP